MTRMSYLHRGFDYVQADGKPFSGIYETPDHESEIKFRDGKYVGGTGFANFTAVDLDSLKPVPKGRKDPTEKFFEGIRFSHQISCPRKRR